ncbi:MAG: zinc transporter ZupT [Candidatus Omnitrophica bacterium]|nr:zinc transporter ZupT [Candidatus Omnitrophota bacterium]
MFENISTYQVMIAFGLTVFAGLSTGIGSTIAFFARGYNKGFLSAALGFSAGVMIYISLVEIFFKAKDSLVEVLGVKAGSWSTVGAFFGGIALVAMIDNLIPKEENPHEIHHLPENGEGRSIPSLHRTGTFVALAIAIHNFPEGIATFMSALGDTKLGVMIAVAVAVHNIPEGIAVSVPIYYASGKRRKAFVYSFLSGLAEPVGALIGYVLLRPFFNQVVFGTIFAGVAGIMVFISIDELVPSAEEYGEHHYCIYGFVAGMAVMALSLLLFI